MKNIFLFFSILLLSAPASAKEWAFTAYLDGKEMGEHTFLLQENGDSKQLTSTARFKVKILFINAYQYFHVAKEQWQQDCLTALDARTEENRDIAIVKGASSGSDFKVDGPKGKFNLPDCPMTFAYWNPKMLTQTKLLNPQTGEWLDVKIKNLGTETIEVKGLQQVAEHYRLEATKMKIELWYSPDKEWLALKSTTPEGYVVTYKLK